MSFSQRLPLAGRRHLPHWHHRGQRAGGPARHCHRLPDPHRQADGLQELLGQGCLHIFVRFFFQISIADVF